MRAFSTRRLWVLEMAALAVAAFFVASGVGELIAGAATRVLPAPAAVAGTGEVDARAAEEHPVDPGPAELVRAAILSRNIFDSETGPLVPGSGQRGEQPVPRGELECCEDGLAVLVTVATEAGPDGSFALLEHGGERVRGEEGDRFAGYTIETIGWRYVVLADESGRRCYLDLHGDPGRGVRTAGGGSGS